MKTFVLSPAKGNSLYWLGRYTERIYLCLHLLRKCYDMMIDGDTDEYSRYISKVGSFVPYLDEGAIRRGLVNDATNPASLISCIECANDNALVVREEITSHTLGYVQLSLEALRKSSKADAEPNMDTLQTLTDWMLAFWGSVEERVYDNRVKTLLKIGKLVEHIDMNLRFGYKFYRIEEALMTLSFYRKEQPNAFNQEAFDELKALLVEGMYEPENMTYLNKVLSILGNLVTL